MPSGTGRLRELLGSTLLDAENLNQREPGWPITVTVNVLREFQRILQQEGTPDLRLLRAFRDLYVVTFRNHHDTPLMANVEQIDDQLNKLFPEYRFAEPLGLDFGKGEPF